VAATRREEGQAAVELVAALPALLLVLLVALQLAVVGYGLWTSANAARAGARASYVGGEAREAARSAVPAALRRGSRVREGQRALRVSLEVPSLLPGAGRFPIEARAGLDPGEG
jgi:hypothetical protein